MARQLLFKLSGKKSIIRALKASGKEQEELFREARKIREAVFGNRAEARSVIEYSNICEQDCKYCGLNRESRVDRYILDDETVFRRVHRLYHSGRRVIMFQTGECSSESYFRRFHALLKEVKLRHKDLSIICCTGNLSRSKMKSLRDIGIERYLLKFETSDPRLYRKIKPTDTLKNRLRHLKTARELGFQVSSGNIIGIPGQTLESIADDLLLLREMDLPMASNSVFIPNEMSEFAGEAPGSLCLALNATAILRILCPNALIPSTSSLETLKKGGQYLGLLAGANTVTLHDGTPKNKEEEFVLYSTGRAIPKNILFKTAEKAGLECYSYSLIRNKPGSSLFDRLITANTGKKHPAVICDGKKYSYRKIFSFTSRFSSFLEEQGIEEGAVVLLSFFDSIELITCLLTCFRLGIIAGAVDPSSSPEEWKKIFSEVSPELVLASSGTSAPFNRKKVLKISEAGSSEKFLSLLEKYPSSDKIVRPDANNPAAVIFTSGTTGFPKAVIHTYKDLSETAFPDKVLKIKDNDIMLSASRLHTSFGLGNSLLFPLAKGATSLLSRNMPNPHSLLKLLKHEPSLFCAVPSFYGVLLKSSFAPRGAMKSVRMFVASGEKLYPATALGWEKLTGKELIECYGTTEMCHPFISNLPGKVRYGSCGLVLPGFEVRFSKSGRIFYRGPSLTCGYLNDTENTRRRIVKGWFKSDDLGHISSDGRIYFDGRLTQIIKSGGKWISIVDIEEKLRSMPLLEDIAVVKNPGGLDYYVSLIKKTGSRTAEKEIREYCAKKLRISEFPGKIHILDSIPRTPSGKIKRKKLK
ncbi:MAG: AMP-binding protein [Candidatus Omnitrophica bacterium]|nr:AMP-binding protein [Candidatus Omnitrophota bacterium]